MWGPGLVMHEAQGIPVALASTLIHALIPGPTSRRSARAWACRAPRGRALRAGAVRAVGDLLARGDPPAGRRAPRRPRPPPLGGSVNALSAGCRSTWWRASRSSTSTARDLPAGVHYVGPLLWHPPRAAGQRGVAGRVPADRPWVHVTEGTSHFQEPFVLRPPRHGLAGAGVRGHPDDRAQPRATALDHARRAERPRARLAQPRRAAARAARALVTTGGAGHDDGRPPRRACRSCWCPTSWDKPDNALRMVEAGVAVRLAAAALHARGPAGGGRRGARRPELRAQRPEARRAAGGRARARRRGALHRGTAAAQPG